mmetsp:Transcript_56080/g.133585  ORF Transcript_56080/g.133585 Transcript_56080/m.133585 type:complete len:236 (-) Transcript_56080:1450-2157(-)
MPEESCMCIAVLKAPAIGPGVAALAGVTTDTGGCATRTGVVLGAGAGAAHVVTLATGLAVLTGWSVEELADVARVAAGTGVGLAERGADGYLVPVRPLSGAWKTLAGPNAVGAAVLGVRDVPPLLALLGWSGDCEGPEITTPGVGVTAPGRGVVPRCETSGPAANAGRAACDIEGVSPRALMQDEPPLGVSAWMPFCPNAPKAPCMPFMSLVLLVDLWSFLIVTFFSWVAVISWV